MTLNPTYDSPVALFHKLEREQYRAYHERNAAHKADHFFNFCVTAQAIRDYFFEYPKKMEEVDRQRHIKIWKEQSLLVAVNDIANSSKHFVLRKPVATKRVTCRKDQFMDIYSDGSGRIRVLPVMAPDISVTLSDGSKYALHTFTTDVLNYWHTYLAQHGMKVRRQSFASMSGGGS